MAYRGMRGSAWHTLGAELECHWHISSDAPPSAMMLFTSAHKLPCTELEHAVQRYAVLWHVQLVPCCFNTLSATLSLPLPACRVLVCEWGCTGQLKGPLHIVFMRSPSTAYLMALACTLPRR